MDCEACEDRLLDLLYGDLTGPQADEVRASMEECEGCRETFERLEEGKAFAAALPMVEAPTSMDAIIMAAEYRQRASLRGQRRCGHRGRMLRSPPATRP